MSRTILNDETMQMVLLLQFVVSAINFLRIASDEAQDVLFESEDDDIQYIRDHTLELHEDLFKVTSEICDKYNVTLHFNRLTGEAIIIDNP